MRIALFTSTFPSISETFLLTHIKTLLQQGHEVDILARVVDDKQAIHPDVHQFDLLKRCYAWGHDEQNLSRRRTIQVMMRVLCQDARLFLIGLRHGRAFRRQFRINIFYPLSCFLQNGPYDVVLCHYGFNGAVLTRLKDLGLIHEKMILFFHGADIRWGLNKGGQVFRHMFEKADKIVSTSQYNYENVIHFGASTEKVAHIPIGIDVDRFRIVRTYREQKGPYYFLTISRLEAEKNLHIAIEAMAAFKKRNPRMVFRYLIAGAGPLKEDLSAQINTLGLHKDILLLGALNQHRILDHIAQADVFVLPSEKEALPLSLMEAQAGGLPAIAADVGSIRDVVVNQESGFLIEPRNVDALVEKLEYCMDYPREVFEMGRFGQKIMAQRFDAHILNQELLALIESVQDQTQAQKEKSLLERVRHKFNEEARHVQAVFEKQRDAYRLKARFNIFRSIEEEVKANKNVLLPYYEAYCDTQGCVFTPISLELAAFLLAYCQRTRPKRLLDLGTGFSSFVFRWYAQKQPDVTVFSVDDDGQSLARAQNFLQRYGLSTEWMMPWDGFHIHQTDHFDLAFHNLGTKAKQEETLSWVLGHIQSGGACVLNDMQEESFLTQVKRIVKVAKADLYSLNQFTKDQYERYGALIMLSEVHTPFARSISEEDSL